MMGPKSGYFEADLGLAWPKIRVFWPWPKCCLGTNIRFWGLLCLLHCNSTEYGSLRVNAFRIGNNHIFALSWLTRSLKARKALCKGWLFCAGTFCTLLFLFTESTTIFLGTFPVTTRNLSSSIPGHFQSHIILILGLFSFKIHAENKIANYINKLDLFSHMRHARAMHKN